jgi:hypothetical protein
LFIFKTAQIIWFPLEYGGQIKIEKILGREKALDELFTIKVGSDCGIDLLVSKVEFIEEWAKS